MATHTHASAAARRSKAGRLRVEDVMTVQPVTIGRGQPLAMARRMMHDVGAHHLPVLEHGELVGIVSERDLRFLERVAAKDVDLDRVEDAMSQEAYVVGPDEPIENVAATMADRRFGCAVVVERGRVIGIFTTTDALDLIAGRFDGEARS